MCECSAAADRYLSDRPAALKQRIQFNGMQSFSAGTHGAFPRLLLQPAGQQLPEANERQFGLLFICAGWFTGTIRRDRLPKSRAVDCCSILQSTARAKTGFQSGSDHFRMLGHSWIDSIQPYVQLNRLNMFDCLSENLKFRNRTSSWKYRCVGLRVASRLSRKRRHQTVGTMFPITLNPPGRKCSPKGDMCL